MKNTHHLSLIALVVVLGFAAAAHADDAYRPYYLIDNPPPPGTHVVVHSALQRATTATMDALVDFQKGVTDVTTSAFDGLAGIQHDTVVSPYPPFPPHAVAQDDSGRTP